MHAVRTRWIGDRSSSLLARGIALAALIAPALPAQSELLWRNRSNQPPGSGDLTFDSGRGRLVMVAARMDPSSPQSDTWEWDGQSWHLRPTASSPAPGAPLAYDSSRHRVVRFGGGIVQGPPFLPPNDETWEYDGVDWQRRSPATSPSARRGHATAYDRRRHRVVLFGGSDALGSNLADTWEWDGANWTQRIVLSSPPARGGAGMAYDPVRQRSVLFGGSTGAALLADTWEWDGARWTQPTPSLSPPARTVTGFFFEPNTARIVLSGGSGSGNPSNLTDRWEWDGTSWRSSYAAALTPFWGSVVFDLRLGEEVLVGGASVDSYSFFLGPRVYRGGATGKYREIVPSAIVPPRRSHAMAYDMSRARTVLFGGIGDDPTSPLADTWEWDGQRWTRPSLAVVPPARSGHRMAYDMVRQRVVMFGGWPLADTWEWDGTAWHRVATSGPAARSNPAMAFDVTRGVTVLFGGVAGLQAFFDDLWEWNGVAWSQRTVATRPSPRHSSAMVCDLARGEMLLYGGFVPGARPGRDLGVLETWILNGAGWRQVLTAHTPSLSPLVYDQQRFRSLLIGAQVFGWDGFDWQEVGTDAAPLWSGEFAAVYDTNRHRTVLFGGQRGTVGDETWELGPRGVDVGTGCRGSNATVPRFSIASPPRLGGAYRATLDGLVPAATFAVVIAGASDTTSPLGPLPIDLTSIGMPGCMLAVSPDQFTVVAAQSGHAEYIVQVPDAPALVGLTTSDQAACPDAVANALGVTLSNAVRATVEW